MLKMVSWGGLACALVLLLGDCAPEPQYVSCENDAMCHDADSRFHYCADSHCVECVTSSECKNGMSCRAGWCKPHQEAVRAPGGSS